MLHPIPSDEEIRDLAGRFGFPDGVDDALVSDAADCRDSVAAHELIGATQHTVLTTPPFELMLHPWPEPPTPLTHGVAIVALLPQAEERYAERGVAADIVAATLWDVGQQIDVHRRIRGTWGMTETSWLAHHVQARIAQLGRLQFALDTHWMEPDPALAVGKDEPVLAVHIPETGPFPPEACDDSFERAEWFFDRHYPDHPWRAHTCVSWLLDPELGRTLGPTSNIASFQRRFTPSPGFTFESDDAIIFTFRTTDTDTDRLPTDTSLQRAVVDRLRRGERWTVRAGSIPRPASL